MRTPRQQCRCLVHYTNILPHQANDKNQYLPVYQSFYWLLMRATFAPYNIKLLSIIYQSSLMLHFNRYVQEGEAFIREIAGETNTPWDMIRAFRQMRAVLHALRNRLTPEHSLQLIAQLPMLIKAVYVEGWKINTDVTSIRHMGDFIELVREEGGTGLINDLVTDQEVKKVIESVFNVLKKHVSEGEIKDIIATLPMELRPLLATA